MKKLKLLLAGLFVTLIASSQAGQINQINIVNFTVKNTLPGTVDSWLSTPGALVLTAQKVPSAQVKEPIMILQIRSGGAIICGNSMANPKRIDPFDVRVFTTADLTGILGGCHELKAGTYTLCVQFFNIDKVAISREVCKDFKVEDAAVDYSPPTLITPDNGKKFSLAELQQPVQFRWTPLVPKPREPVTYRLRVWQLMQGQNGIAAMKSNTPVVEKDVKEITQAVVSGIITGPCKPPYMCDFIWNIQAINRDGKPMGRNNGLSEAYTFSAKEENNQCPNTIFPEDKKQFNITEAKSPITFKWAQPTPGSASSYRLKVWQLMQGQNGQQAMKSNQPVVTKDVDNITQVTISNLYTGPCKPPYLCDFIWAVEMIGRDGKATCTSEAKTFSVAEQNSKGPENVFPEDKKKFTLQEAMKPVTFKWKPILPKPREQVTYRLKVWQLMQGQNGQQAMKTNPPLAALDVDGNGLTGALADGILYLITGPCKPPYLCDFIWNVEAVTRDGNTAGSSEPTTFSVTEENKCPTNVFPEDKKQFSLTEAKNAITFKWTNPVPGSAPPMYRLKVWQLMQGQSGQQAMKSNQPVVTKEVTNGSEVSVAGVITGPCKPPYLCDFIWAVEMIGRDGQTTCTTGSTTFHVSEEILPPQNVLPENKKGFSIEEAKKDIKFQWTPVSPKQNEAVTYRLKVWQLMQGQNGQQAMKSNQPIVTKEVINNTETTVNGIITGPCKPPYLCDFIWDVQALNREGKPLGSNNGTSEPTMFFVSQYIIQLDSIKVLCTSKPGVYSFSYTISNVNPGTATLTNFAITSSVPGGATLGTFTPPIGTSILSGNQLTITGTINAATNLSNICIGAEITDAVNSFWKASKDTCVKVLPCKCDVCDSVKIEVTPKGEIKLDTAGNIIQTNTITVTPKPVKNIKAELVYFEYKPESDDCMICNKDSKTYGNFIGASTGLVSPTIPFPHTVNWAPNGQMVTNQAIDFVISMPPTVKCCAAQVKWCIRYVVTFMDCTVCNKLVCYTYNKKCDCK